MPERTNTVVPDCTAVGEDKFHAQMMLGVSRMIAAHGRDKVALALGVSPRQLGNLANGSFPAPHRLWNLLALDPTALDDIARLYRRELRPTTAQGLDDFGTVARISHLAGQWTEALADGKRDHTETLALAEAIRPLLHQLGAVVAEADRHRGSVQ